MADSGRDDYRELLTKKIIEQLESGTAPWQKPWNPANPGEGGYSLPYNPTTNKPYRGANALYLSAVSESQGYGDPRWMTYKQAQEAGYQVRRGQKGSQIEYWKFTEERPVLDGQGKPIIDDKGEPKKELVALDRPRVFRAVVFNATQMDGVPELSKTERTYPWNPLERAESILTSSGAKIIHDQPDRAFYSSGLDQIHLPQKAQFPDASAYYSTALHELGHWTGHKSRLDRDLANPFGSVGYAKEELRAELASLFLADRTGIPHDPGQHAAYVKSWVQVLRDDKNEIFRAARDAEKITEYVLSLDRQQEIVKAPGKAKEAHEMTLAEFEQTAQAVKLENHGRKWEVFRDGKSYGFSDEPTAKLAVRDAHQAEVNNALYSQVADPPEIRKSMPPAAVIAEYPELREKFPEIFPPKNDVGERTYLDVSFKEKGTAKGLGAKWDNDQKAWFVPPGVDTAPFQKWLPDQGKKSTPPGPPMASPAAPATPEVTAIEYTYIYRAENPEIVGKREPVSLELTLKDGDKTLQRLEGLSYSEASKLIGAGNTRNIAGGLAGILGGNVSTEEHPKWADTWVDKGRLEGVFLVERPSLARTPAIEASPPQAEQGRGSSPSTEGESRVVLNVPFKEKDEAKLAGAKWDKKAGAWYAPAGSDLAAMEKWLPKNQVQRDPVTEFAERIREAGLIVEGSPIMDGKRHRVPVVGGKHGAKDGMYVGYLDGKPSGFIQNFKTGHEEKWTTGQKLSPTQLAQLGADIERNQAERAERLSKQHDELARFAEKRWETYKDAPPNGKNAYLERKGVGAYGVRFNGEQMVVPIRDASGKLWSLQYISPEEGAQKHLLKNAKKEGNMHIMGRIEPRSDIFVAEGYATAATGHEATGKPTVMAVDSGNLPAVVGELRSKFPTNRIFILADDDRTNERNVGLEKALKAAEEHRVGVIVPRFTGPGKDWNDLHQHEGMGMVRQQIQAGITQSMDESRQAARQLAAGKVGDNPTEVAPGMNTRHTGEVLGSSAHHTAQSIGRGSMVIHETDKLDRPPPSGREVTVQYAGGRGQINDKQLDQSRPAPIQDRR